MFGCKKSKIALFFVWVFAVSVLAAAPRLQSKLLLPEKIYAVPGIESNIYYENIFHTHNPANYSFEFLCEKGNNDAKRVFNLWTFHDMEQILAQLPAAEKAVGKKCDP